MMLWDISTFPIAYVIY